MRKTQTKIEIVSVREAKKILKRERLLAATTGHGKRKLTLVKSPRRSSAGPKQKSTKPEVSTS